MQILQSSFKIIQTLLSDKPELTDKYVNTSIATISYFLGPLNLFMRHLLIVKGLDPDVDLAKLAASKLQQETDQLFEIHQKSYDDDFDFSLVQKKLEETRYKLRVNDESLADKTDYEVFAKEINELVVEELKPASEDTTQEKVELLKQMIANGLCGPDGEDTQRWEIDKWSNDSLKSMKRILDKHTKPYPASNNIDAKFRGSFRKAPKAE